MRSPYTTQILSVQGILPIATPNTGDLLPYVPTQYNVYDSFSPANKQTNLTTSIRIGDACGRVGSSSPNAQALHYYVHVTPDNALMILYYACVVQAASYHTNAENAALMIRVQSVTPGADWANNNNWHHASPTGTTYSGSMPQDTMAYFITATPATGSGAGIHDGVDGWHHYDNPNGTGYDNPQNIWWKEWSKVIIDLTPYMYTTVRIEVMISDCSMVQHYAYAYICGECRPMRTEADTTSGVITLTAPQGLMNYVWYRSEYGGVPSTISFMLPNDNPNSTAYYTFHQLTPAQGNTDSSYQYIVQPEDFSVEYRPNEAHIQGIPASADSTCYEQVFRCDITSALDPSKPYTTKLYTIVQRPNQTEDEEDSTVVTIIPDNELPLSYIREKYDTTGHFVTDTFYHVPGEMMEFTAEPTIPVQYFNGMYTVEEIPYSPIDTTFWLNGMGTKLPIEMDDAFSDSISIPFPFYFFGNLKSRFYVGDNGIVTFTDSFISDYYQTCPYNFSAPIPWTQSTSGAPYIQCFNNMHDAIYGVYSDLYTGYNGAYLAGSQGMYYGVMGEYPNRKMVVTYNQIPVFNNLNDRQSTQIVFHEATNNIEVHVKHRGIPSTSNGYGIIGIQNATGQPQVQGSIGSSTMYVMNGAPAAFWPEGYNPSSTSFDNKSFRFSPQGYTQYAYWWYRLLDNGDTIQLHNIVNDPSAVFDTNGYYYPMEVDSEHPRLTRMVANATGTARYVFELRFLDANNNWYMLYDTVTVIGGDTAYCLPNPATRDNEGLISVAFGGMTNDSIHPDAAPYYGNYSAMQGYVAAGTNAQVDVTYSTGYTYGTLIWVDWNQSMSFEADEIVYAGTSTNARPTTLNASFYIPLSQAPGSYRMRIAGTDMYFDSYINGSGEAPSPCFSSNYAVAEDYTLVVTGASSCPDIASVYVSQVTSYSITLGWVDEYTGSRSYTIYNMEDNSVVATSVEGDLYEVTGLSSETYYTFGVEANCPDGEATAIVTVTGLTDVQPPYVTVSVLSNDYALGSVIGGGTYNYGETATLIAIPNVGSLFNGWSNQSADNPQQLTATQDITVTAYFANCSATSTDTMYVYVHDTTYTGDTAYIDVPVHDTTYIHDTNYIDHYLHDTTYVTQYDTTWLTSTDTLFVVDTLVQYDSLVVWDTVINNVHDTTLVDHYVHDTIVVFETRYETDTLWRYDTIYIYIHDTVYVQQEDIGEVTMANVIIYQRDGQLVVEGSDGHNVTLYDVTGRVLATKRDDYMPLRFDVPASGTYLIKIGDYAAKKVVVIR